VLRTPLRRSPWLSAAVAADVYLKLETLQPAFSYKIRGAWNAVLALRERGEASAIVTASAGNHGRAIAHAAKAAGFPVTVYVPATAPRVKVDAIRASGADVRESRDYDEAESEAKENGRRTGAIYISPYSHPDVIAGAGTVGLEILEDLPDADTVVVPVGGGGLISGVAIAVHESGTAVAGVEAEASCPFTQSLAAGRIVAITVRPTLADGLAGNLDPETMTFDIVRRLVAQIAVVSEEQIRAAIRGVALEERLIAEGAAATGVAALLARARGAPDGIGGLKDPGQRVAVVLTGANIDPAKLRAII
jgi:threonine dehydratase